jgi:hypothetical protein
LVQDRVQYNCCKKKIKSRKTFNIVENILSQILSHLTQTIPILQNLNQVTVLVTNYPVPSHSTKRAGPNKNTPIAPSPSKKEKKKSIKYKIEIKAKKQINQIKYYGTSLQGRNKPYMRGQNVAENSTPYNPKPQMPDS